MEDDGRANLQLNEVWRACRKIQNVIFTYNYDICSEFCQHDPHGKGLISESLFTSILGKYKNIVPLSHFEVGEVTDYFRLRDGRVNYRQFCNVVCVNPYDKEPVKDLSHGLEWNDPMHVNALPRMEDRRQLCLILMKIARVNNLPLAPYFQDYELISGNVGVVTVAHFSRVLYFMKIRLSDNDFLLLLKRYLKDSHLVNYAAFIKHVQNIVEYMKERNLMDFQLDIPKDFPGRIVDLELPQLPPVDGQRLAHSIFPDACNHPKENPGVCDVISCIQKYVHKNRVRVREFLEGFDPLHTGAITLNQFDRGLHAIGVGKFVTQREFRLLCERYLDQIDTNRIRWQAFEEEIDSVFTVKRLEKMPQLVVESPPPHIAQLPRPGAMDWQETPESTRDLCEEVVVRIQMRIRNRRLHLQPFFRTYDKLNSGHVKCNQANQILLTNGILLSGAELKALQARYGNELGFNYTKFLEDADPAEYGTPNLKEPAALPSNACPNATGTQKGTDDEELTEEVVIKVLANAKRQAVTRSIPVLDFLEDYDRHREGEILEPDFRRGMHAANINLSTKEMDMLCKIFRSPKRACCILYRDFVKSLNEVFIELESSTGDNVITAVPLIHLANLDCVECFLNYDERLLCSQGLMKLARQPDEISNLSSVMKDFDREQCGTIRKNQFIRALTVRDMHYMISTREFEAIYKCFGAKRGLDIEFKYREFLNMLSILHKTGQIKRNF